MSESHTRGETHGCIVCGKLHQIYAVYDRDGHFLGAKAMGAGSKIVQHPTRPLVACEQHSDDQIKGAVQRVYGDRELDEEE